MAARPSKRRGWPVELRRQGRDQTMTVSVKIESDLAWVSIDNPPVNTADHSVRAGLMKAVTQVDLATVSAAILICEGRTFVAGADVREFGQVPQPPHLPDVINAIEAGKTPWVAAIHGTALGGGLEIALGCAYRVAVASAKLGLPEVALGLIPGAGGTVRLPRLIGADAALGMIIGGKPVTAAKALAMGLLDHITGDDLRTGAADFARNLRGKPRPSALLMAPPVAASPSFEKTVAAMKAKAGGQNSIAAAADAVARGQNMDGITALAAERAAFVGLKEDPQSIALRHIFFAERSVGKLPLIKGVTPAPVKNIGVIGGGTMGSGIAAACLLAGLSVTMVERDDSAAALGHERVAGILAGAEQRGKLASAAVVLADFETSTAFAALGNADLVIEAVFEDMVAKAEVFAALDAVLRPDAIIASNTSYLDVTVLAAATAHPERMIGLHFFSPAHVMKLLEVILPDTANARAVATGMALGKRLGKIAVPAGVCDGFIGNRIMSAYRREADYMIEDGAFPDQIDAAMRAFGFPIGVFQMQDLAGLDIAWAMRRRRAATRPASERYVHIADQLCQVARFGRKSGQGWYDYRDDPQGAVDPVVTALIIAASAAAGIRRVALTADDIIGRLLAVMQAEGAALLAEGIAATPEAIDVVMVNGFGFPRWRGGPMFMAGK